MKYGYKCISTMCGIEFYIIEDTKESCLQAFENFKNYIYNEPNTWEIYCSTFPVYCDEDSDYSFTVGKKECGNYVIVTDYGCLDRNNKIAIEFELLGTFKDRF